MRKIFLLSIIVLMLFFSGCTSYFSNLTAEKHPLKPDEYAVFEKEGNRFSAQIQNFDLRYSGSAINGAEVTVLVRNTGTKAVSLMAYPRLSDATGNDYPGNSIFMGTISPGGTVTGKSVIAIPAPASGPLKEKATLILRFQDTKLIPYEASWEVEIPG
jgi:hypothetical protein